MWSSYLAMISRSFVDCQGPRKRNDQMLCGGRSSSQFTKGNNRSQPRESFGNIIKEVSLDQRYSFCYLFPINSFVYFHERLLHLKEKNHFEVVNEWEELW
jgi:hypothetical protein